MSDVIHRFKVTQARGTVGQITIFLDINRIRHKMVKNAIKVGNIRRKTSLGQNLFA